MGAVGAEVDISEAVSLSAVDPIFYSHFFFQKTVRQASPTFHNGMWEKLDGTARKVGFAVFRGGAKTTLFRLFISKRVAFAISRTILVVGKSQDASKRTIEWIMRQVEYNRLWAGTFQLRKGSKWTSEECEIYHGTDEVPIRLIAIGITGSARGINVDDHRPDLICVDDPCDEENTATSEQRKKTEDLVLGSLANSLAPASESPLAKIVVLQTILHPEDVISRCLLDHSWSTVRIPVFDAARESVWPERWSTETLMREKQAYAERGKLGLWMREMECTVIAEETAVFRRESLQFFAVLPPEDELTTFLVCDPVPPPSEREEARGLQGKDYEAWAVVGLWRDLRHNVRKIFLCEYRTMRGHDPDWSVATFFELLERWKPIKLKVESVAYQRTLAWLIERAMRQRGKYIQIDAHIPEKRKKAYRIIDSIGNAVANSQLYVSPTHLEFIEQFTSYPNVSHDDLIEAVAVGVQEASTHAGGATYEAMLEIENVEFEELMPRGACP